VIHHVRDLSRATENLRRVVVPGGYVLVRSVFPDSTHGVTLFRFFPTARRIAESFPSVEDLSAAMAAAGFRLLSRRPVTQCSHPSLAALHERVLRRADTTLLNIPDLEYRAGLERLHRAMEREEGATPVIDSLDLVAFG
jgi:SAM-dependent methyltransferase